MHEYTYTCFEMNLAQLFLARGCVMHKIHFHISKVKVKIMGSKVKTGSTVLSPGYNYDVH